jgi:hypothetical protein
MPRVDCLGWPEIHPQSLPQEHYHFRRNVRRGSFGAKFLCTIDRTMHFFFKRVQQAESVAHLSHHVKHYLRDKAVELVDGILESKAPINIVLPFCLTIPENIPLG